MVSVLIPTTPILCNCLSVFCVKRVRFLAIHVFHLLKRKTMIIVTQNLWYVVGGFSDHSQ